MLEVVLKWTFIIIVAAIDRAPSMYQHHSEEMTLTNTFIYYNNSMVQERYSHFKNKEMKLKIIISLRS